MSTDDLAEALPAPKSDFRVITDSLTEKEREKPAQVRAFVEKKANPIVNDYWQRDAFPFELWSAFKYLNIMGRAMRDLVAEKIGSYNDAEIGLLKLTDAGA
jgi:hypothetical protein